MGWSATSFQFREGTATLGILAESEQTAADYLGRYKLKPPTLGLNPSNPLATTSAPLNFSFVLFSFPSWVDDELLYYYDRFYVPQAVRMEVLRRLHDTPYLGQKRTLELVQRK